MIGQTAVNTGVLISLVARAGKRFSVSSPVAWALTKERAMQLPTATHDHQHDDVRGTATAGNG